MRHDRVMREAWRHWRYALMKGWASDPVDPWTWARCLRFAHSQAKARAPSGFENLQLAMQEARAREGQARPPRPQLEFKGLSR
jgi:hypothetical protein